MTKIFYSWQSDRPTSTGRNLIERALQRAIGMLQSDAEIEEALRDELAVDKDTSGVPGSPPIAEAIFKKIDAASVFVPDLTFVGVRTEKAQPTPNPNVLVEYGWALKSRGHERIVAVMNDFYGEPSTESLPFDLKHLRFPIRYTCPPDASQETRSAAQVKLARDLARAIKLILSHETNDSTTVEQVPFVPRESQDGPARFRSKGEPLGEQKLPLFLASQIRSEVHLANGAAMWLRVHPDTPVASELATRRIESELISSGRLCHPLNWNDFAGASFVRGADGFGVVVRLDLEIAPVPSVFYVFATGEVWTIDTALAAQGVSEKVAYVDLKNFAVSLKDSIQLLTRLDVPGPFHWIAGIEGLKDRHLIEAGGPQKAMTQRFLVDVVTCSGVVADASVDEKEALAPFFEKLRQQAHG